MVKYEVVKGRFAMTSTGKTYDTNEIVDLTEEQEKKEMRTGIIGDVLIKVEEGKVAVNDKDKKGGDDEGDNGSPDTPPAPPGETDPLKELTPVQKGQVTKLVKTGMSQEDAIEKVKGDSE